MRCSYCGEEARRGDTYCARCGRELEDPGPPLWEPRLAPDGGLPVRSDAAASAPTVADLAPGTQLLVLERRGGWARVSVESGWSGWVDDSVLVDPDLLDPPPTLDDDGSRR